MAGHGLFITKLPPSFMTGLPSWSSTRALKPGNGLPADPGLMDDRGDDVLNVSGHRIGNSEVESALVSHPHVSEAAVVGRPDDLKGESITAFVVLKIGVDHSEELLQELRGHVAEEIGKIARPDTIYFVNDLPKTRSGKIMRRVVRSALISKEVGDISTLSNPEAVHEIEIALQSNKKTHG